MANVRAIIYDAGRTLVKPRPRVPEIWAFLSDHLGLDLEPERRLPDWGRFYNRHAGQNGLDIYASDAATRSFWAEYYAQALRDAEVDRSREELLSAGHAVYDWYQTPEQWELYPETLEALRSANERGLTQGVISDWGTDLPSILHAHQITQYLDFVVASAAVGAAKPHPEIFRRALARMDGIDPASAVYVGDSYVADVLGARSVGISPVLIDRGGRAPAMDCPVVSSLLDVLELIEAPP